MDFFVGQGLWRGLQHGCQVLIKTLMMCEKTRAWKLKYSSAFSSYYPGILVFHYFAFVDPQLHLKTDMT